MISRFGLLIVFLLLYGLLIPYYAGYLAQRPVLERVGYVPPPEIIRFSVADQNYFVSSALVIKVLTYFGGLSQIESNKQILESKPAYYEMYKLLDASIKLDPYNMDAYYFSQAILAWDAKQIVVINKMLEYGFKYRTWDWYLPFFIGFNYAYFLKDFKNAAEFYKKAGELSGSDLFMRLAGRYLYDVGQTEQAILYLTAMAKTAKSDSVKKNLEMRLNAFKSVLQLEKACKTYVSDHGNKMPDVETLLAQGYVEKKPLDPYGGKFAISEGCKVTSSSGFYAKAIDEKKH